MSKMHKKICEVLNYIDNSFIVISTITGCVFIYAFASLVGISIGITTSAIGLKICLITGGIKKYKTMNKKNKKKHDTVVLLGKYQLNIIEILTSKVLIHSDIGQDELVLINNMLKEFFDTKAKIKNFNKQKFKLYINNVTLLFKV